MDSEYFGYGQVKRLRTKMDNIKVRTSDKELYMKLRSLRFTDEVIINRNKTHQVNKIMNNVNKQGNVLISQRFNDRIILTRLKPINFNLYYVNR